MKSFTGKFASVRGWALLLALLLGAGMMISACGDEEVPAPTTPAPTPTPPAPEPEPEPEPEGPGTPANLRVSATTATSITWTWDAVEGVLGYQGQFSTDTTFADNDPTFLVVAPATSHTVSNLSGSMTGHFRVRSGTGTSLTDLQYSEWTDGVSGTTDAPPAATALAAPGNFEASDPEDDSIVLSWDEVDDAESYEVEQRLDGGSDWSDASCGDGGNVVEATQCIAGGLDEGTDYEFRVRGLPADDSTAHIEGEWAETDGSTTGQQQVPTTGGMGMGNVRWHNGGDNNATITFVWDREGDAMYETAMLALEGTGDNLLVVDNVHVENPCADVADSDSADTPRYASRGAATSQDITPAAPGTVMGLCVREEGGSDVSFAWGISPPEEPNNGDRDIDKLKTVALEWTDVDLKASFDYEVRLASDPERPSGDNNIDDTSMATSRAVQSACDAGTSVDSFTPDINLDGLTVSVGSGLSPNTGYLLCIRASNTAGTGTWAVPITNDTDTDAYGANDSVANEIFTRPAAPPRPGNPTSTSTAATGNDNEMLAPKWDIDTRSVTNVPREHTDSNGDVFFNLAIFASTDADAASLNAAVCSTTDTPDDYETVTATATDGLSGFSVEGAPIERLGFNRKVYLCVQADSNNTANGNDADKGVGPWTISSQFTVSKPSVSLSSSIAENANTNDTTLKISNWNNAWWYSSSPDRDGDTENLQCDSVGAGTDETTFTGVADTYSYTVTAWDNADCDGNRLATRSGVTTKRP